MDMAPQRQSSASITANLYLVMACCSFVMLLPHFFMSQMYAEESGTKTKVVIMLRNMG